MQLVLDTNGLIVKKRNNSFWIMAKEGKRTISPHRISSIAVTADCDLNSSAIRLAAKHNIPIYFVNATGHAEARLMSASFTGLATIRREQAFFAEKPEATQWMLSLFQLKTQHQIANLQHLYEQLPKKKRSNRAGIQQLQAYSLQFKQHQDKLIDEVRLSLMGIEGNMAKLYWKEISSLLPEEFQFLGRSRRPAQDEFNACLNYLYGMLYNLIGSAVYAAGLDPYLGILHTDGYKRPTLVFDMIEPFRPWVDWLLIDQVLNKRILKSYFQRVKGGLHLSKKGKEAIHHSFIQ